MFLSTSVRSGRDRKVLVCRTGNTTGYEDNMRVSWSAPKESIAAGRSVARPTRTRRLLWTMALSLISILILQPTKPAYSADEPPAWAYPMTPPDFKLSPDDGKAPSCAGQLRRFHYNSIA